MESQLEKLLSENMVPVLYVSSATGQRESWLPNCKYAVCFVRVQDHLTVKHSVQVPQKIHGALDGWKERYPTLLSSPGDLLQLIQSAG